METQRKIMLAVKKQLQGLSAEEELKFNELLENERLAGADSEDSTCDQQFKATLENAIENIKKENMKKRLKQRLAFKT